MDYIGQSAPRLLKYIPAPRSHKNRLSLRTLRNQGEHGSLSSDGKWHLLFANGNRTLTPYHLSLLRHMWDTESIQVPCTQTTEDYVSWVEGVFPAGTLLLLQFSVKCCLFNHLGKSLKNAVLWAWWTTEAPSPCSQGLETDSSNPTWRQSWVFTCQLISCRCFTVIHFVRAV